MVKITPINNSDLISDSNEVINDNFTNVNNDKVETSDFTDANIKTKYENNADTNAFTDAEKSKLSGIQDNATENQTDTYLLDRTNHTGTQTADTIVQGSTNDVVTIIEKKALIANLSSGLKSWGIITANTTNPNNVDISAWEGIVVDNTDPLNPIFTRVSWSAQIDVVLTNIASEPITNLYFDKNGVLQQGTLANFNTTRRQNVLLGIVEHIFSPNIESIDNISALPYDTYVNLDEFSSTLGRIKSNTFSTTGLNINLSAGTTFGIGDNKDSQNPNFMNFVAQNAVSFVTTYQDGVWGWTYWASTTTINNTQYDDSTGTLATLANNRATVHLLFWNPLANTFFLQIGQNEYSNIDVAKSSYLSDVQQINPLLGSIIFLWAIGVTKNAVSVWFSQNSDKLGQLGIGGWSWAAATDLQSSYNVSLPAAEIETNTTNWALSLKGGTGTDTDDVLEIKNNAGTITASVQANGVPTKGTDFITKTYADANYAWGGGWLRETIQIAGTQLVNTILYEGAIGKATTLDAWYLTLLTAPTGSSFIVTVSKSTDSGSTYPTSETVTLTATNKYVKWILTTAFTEWDFMKIEITQVGSTVAGQDLIFTVTGS